MRCTIAILSVIAAGTFAAASMAYADQETYETYRIRATLSGPDGKPHSMTYSPSDGVTPLLFKDEAACRHALVNDQSLIDSIALLKAMYIGHKTDITIRVDCVPAAPSI